MAGPYYVDISAPGAWSTRNGLSQGAEWLGLSGLQYAFDTIAVGNGPIYVRGSASDGSKLKNTGTTTSNSGAFARGEGVTWAGGGAGVVSEIDGSNYPTVIEVVGAVALPNTTEVTGSGGGKSTTGTVTQKATIIDVDTNSGDNANGFIKIIGCNDDADYTVNGTRAYIDIKDAAAHGFVHDSTRCMYWYENIEVDEPGTGKNGWYSTSSTPTGHVFINCCTHDAGADGFNVAFNYGLFFRCVSYLNGGDGFNVTLNSKYLLCASHDNSGSGFELSVSSSTFIGCISHGNTDDGFENCAGIQSVIFNCVIDGNGDNGFDCAAYTSNHASTIIGNRFTNHSADGSIALNCNSEPVITGWNYFENNAGDNIQTGATNLHYFLPLEGGAATSNIEDQSNTNQGYAEAVANNNFATGYTDAGDPDLRRTAITIPWT